MGAGDIDNRVVRAGAGCVDALENVSGRGVHDVPEVFLKRGLVNDFAIRRHRHAVTAAFIRLLPQQLAGDEIEAGQRVRGGNVEPLRFRIGADALHIARRAFVIWHAEGDALYELVAVIHVKHQHAVAAPG